MTSPPVSTHSISSPPSADEDHQLLAAAFAVASTGICFLDQDGRILRVNPAMCEMLGYQHAELAGQSWDCIAPAQVASMGRRFLDALPQAPAQLTSEWTISRGDGAPITVLVGFQALTLSGGARRLVGTFIDIDERREAEETALRRSRDLHRDVLENVSEAIIVVQGGQLIYANPRAVEFSGFSLDQLLSMPFSALIVPDDLPRVLESYQRRMAGLPATSRYAHFRVARRDGEALWVESSAVRINWDGKPAMLAFLSDQSERRRQQQALITSEEHHRQVVNNATEGIVVVQDGVIVFANSRMHDLTGQSPQQLCGRAFLADIHPDDRAEAAERYASRIRGEAVPSKVTLRAYNAAQGGYVWLEIAIVAIEWEGRPATLAFLTDITGRKSLEDQLKQSLDERNTVLESSIVGMVFLNAAGRVHWANSAMLQIFRIDPQAPAASSLEPFYPSREAYLQTGAAVAGAVRNADPYETELQLRRHDGTLFWAYLSGRAVNSNDLSRGTVWVVIDISERRALEAALNKSEEHYRLVVNNVTECIFVVQNGRMVFFNPRLSQLTGYSQKELLELPFVTAIHPDDQSLVIERHMRRLRGEEVEQYYQFRIVNRQTAAVIWVRLSAVMIEWEGQPATLSFMTDVTERKRLEDSLKYSVAERIRLETLQIQGELKEAELARRHAEESTHAKSMFLANMSHEIRTPMNAIIGMAHLALGTELDAKQRDFIEKIHGAGLSLLGIINDILDFSKVEAGKLDIERISFSLDEVLANVAAVTATTAHEKQIEYLFHCPLDVPRSLVGDPLRLGQILINLTNNAIKFTERGEVQVNCRCLEVNGNQVKFQFVVRDTGIGMTAEQSQQLFRPFSQADESTTRRYGGTGLGLSIAKSLVELMDGAIWLESAPGVGTTIRFTAWFGQDETEAPDLALPPPLRGMRVLVVDDHPGARTIVSDGLTALSLQVDQASSAGEALNLIHQADAEAPYALIMTDLQMPGMDGIELIDAVRKDDTLNLPPRTVLLVSDLREEARKRIEQAAIDALLMKPVHAGQVAQTFLKLCASDAGGASSRMAGAGQPVHRFRDLVVLLVEDNLINQQIAGEMMRAAGIEVDIAANGRLALEMLDTTPQRYGIVFMDVQMPEMDGHEATRRIRADARFASLPVVAMTAHAMVEERQRCFAAGMNGHLAKPVSPSLLYRTIARWCPGHIAPVELPVPAAGEVAAEGEPLFSIPGLDARSGLARALGSRSFYVEMLGRFRDSQGDTASGIRNALENDRQLALRLAHTLRGAAGLLGAATLHQLCGTLESEIHGGRERDALQPLLDELDMNLQSLHQAIDRVLSDSLSTADRPAPVVDRSAVEDLLARLAALLGESAVEVVDVVARSRNLLKVVFDNESIARLERAVSQYDFEAALALLNTGAANAGYAIRR